MKNFLLIFVGGGIGSALRYYVSLLIKYESSVFPYSTLVVNIIGSFIIGILFSLISKGSLHQNFNLLFAVGFCGGFTTFSTFSKESILMLLQHQWNTFFIYAFLSFVGCLIATYIGYLLAK